MDKQLIAGVYSRALLTIFFVTGGILHFVIPSFYLRMMPPIFPFPLALIYISGFLEILLGISVTFCKQYRIFIRNSLVLLLLGVFPANIYMALHPELFAEFSITGIWLRLPLQGLLILWVWKALSRP